MSSSAPVNSLVEPFLSGTPDIRNGGAQISSNGGFGYSLAVSLASMQAQSITLLFDSGRSPENVLRDWINDSTGQTASNGTGPVASGLSASGRNLSLFDPEAAYRMMTNINNREATYKAQFSELSQMKDTVSTLRKSAENLVGGVDDESVRKRLQEFVDNYNGWIDRFESTTDSGGILSETQAAEISLGELEQSVENRFNGAAHGLHGLSDIGIAIDSATHRIVLDNNALDVTLKTNPQAVLGTLQQFAGNFSHSAELLTSDGNFISNRLGNLDRVIDFIGDNEASLQAEFGLGDPATPSAQVAKALATYNRIYAN